MVSPVANVGEESSVAKLQQRWPATIPSPTRLISPAASLRDRDAAPRVGRDYLTHSFSGTASRSGQVIVPV